MNDAPPEYVEVVNWQEHQHYKTRRPIWIKVYGALLNDYEFSQLPDDGKLHLMLIWLLASQLDNRIPADEDWLTRQLGTTSHVCLAPLVEAGFLKPASKVLGVSPKPR